MKKVIISANAVTCMRIAATVAMVFTEPLSAGFFALYTFAGVTDVLDGFIARRTHTSSEKGARLDSIADLLFYAAMIIRLFPRLFKMLPKRIWIYAATAVVIRLGSYLAALIKYGKFASLHTYMNKLTGAAVFLVPCFMFSSVCFGYCVAVCLIGAVASTEELIIHLSGRETEPDIKSLFHLNKQ